ncbi:MAG: hypothetical protein Q9M37_01490 [Desulfonauticus sp.]|nr:hypothetical protein [Desulfonauticus sp.]
MIPKIYNNYLKSLYFFKTHNFTTQIYRIKKGDNLIKILKYVVHIPKKLIFNEYLTLTQLLNPTLDLDRIKIGNILNLPIPASQATKFKHLTSQTPQTTYVQPKKTTKFISSTPYLKNSSSNKKLCSIILKALGFEIVPGIKTFFPTQNGWIQIDLTQNILINVNSKKILFTQNPVSKNSMPDSFEIISVSSWEPREILSKLREKYPFFIKLWPKDQNFIYNSKHFSLEIKSDLIVKIKNKLFVFFINNNNKSLINNLNTVYSLLKNININFVYIEKTFQDVRKINCKFIRKNLIFTPRLNKKQLLSILKSKILFKTNDTIVYILKKLKNEKLLKLKTVYLNLFQLNNKYIKLYPHIIKIDDTNFYIYKDNNQYVLSLLRLNGYQVYSIEK